MNKKLLIVFLCSVILYVGCVQSPHSLNSSGLKEELHILNVESQNNVTKIGEKQELLFSIKNLTYYTIKNINIKLESTFTTDNENFSIDELKPNEECHEKTSFYILDNIGEKKIKFVITYVDINNDLKICEYYDKIDIQINMTDQYLKMIPFIWLFFIFLGMFIVSYKIIIEYRKKHLKDKDEIPPIYNWKDHL